MKIKILQITLITLLGWCSSQNTFAQGGTLALNSTVNGNLTSATPDVYYITTTSDGLLRLTLTTFSTADLYVTLYDNDGATIVGNAVESLNKSTVTLSTDGLAPGTYHAKITPNGTNFGSYTLTDTLFTTTLANDPEPNGNRATAVAISQNGSSTGHLGYYYNLQRDTTDWYKVTTNADGLLRVYVSTQRGSVYSTNILDVNVFLYDNDGTTQLGNVEVYNGGGPGTNMITADGLAPGTYYIKLQSYSSNQFANYTIADSLFTTPVANDPEPNGNRATAVAISQNGSSTGHLGYYYNLQRDTTDWYKVTTNADGLLRVYVSTQRGSVYSTNILDVNVFLYDNDGTTQLGNVEVYNGGGPGTNMITADGLAPGTYYIKLQSYSSNQFANYTVADSLLTTPVANDAEPNNIAATAVTLPLNGSSTGHNGYYYNNQRDTTDWYKVTTTSDGLLRVTLRTQRGSAYSNNTLDVNIFLYDNDGTTQLGSTEVYNGGNAGTNTITTDGLAPGTYYIKLQSYSASEFTNYTLSDSLLTPPTANDIEPNGTTATAVTLPLNNSKTGRVGYYYNNVRDTTDWYKVTTTSDGLLRVYLTSARGSAYSSNTLDLNVFLFDNNGTSLLGNMEVYNGGNPGTNVFTTDGLAAGTYYIKIQPYSSSQFADYTISDSLFIPTVINDVEPNGTPATALLFPINSATRGHSGYYYNNQRDTSDWYKLTTAGNGPLTIYLSMLRGSIYSNNTLDMVITLYSNDGTTQQGNKEIYNGGAPKSDSLTFASLAAGTYLLKVTNFSSSEFADYILSNSITPDGGALPVTFINFDGTLRNGQAWLNWSTATEINNKGFEVEKSMDGQTFNDLAFVDGHGNSSLVNNYSYIDNKVLSGYNYYRLKQIDIDGKLNYSSTIRLDFKNFDWAIIGNPVTSNSWIQLQLTSKSKVAIQIISIDGKVMKTINKGTIDEGTYSIPLQLGNVPAGIYIVRLIAGNQVFSKKIVR